MKRLSQIICFPVVVWTFALISIGFLNTSAKAEQISCLLLIESLESNITLSLRTSETLLANLSADAPPGGTLIGDKDQQFLIKNISLVDLVSAKISLVLEDLNAMNQIGTDCIEVGHFNAVVGQARSAYNIDQYLHEKFTSASSETAVFLTIATAQSLLGRAINHKKNILSALVADGYFLQ